MFQDKLFTFISISDDSVSGVMLKFGQNGNDSEYDVLAKSVEYIDPTSTKERFLSTPALIETKLLRLITALEDKSGYDTSKVVVCLPNSAFHFQKALINYLMPFNEKITKYDITRIEKNIVLHFLDKPGILVNVENEMHTLDDVVTVRSILGLECSKVTSIAFATSLNDDFKTKLNYVLKSCDLEMEFCTTLSYAMAESYGHLIDFANGSLLLHINYHETCFSVVNEFGTQKMSFIPLGIHSIILSIAQNLHIDNKLAYKIFHLYCGSELLVDSNAVDGMVLDKAKFKRVVTKALIAIIDRVAKEISGVLSKVAISKVIVDGKITTLPDVQDIVQNIFNIPCVLPIKESFDDRGGLTGEFEIFTGIVNKFIKNRNTISSMNYKHIGFMDKIQNMIYFICNKVESVI